MHFISDFFPPIRVEKARVPGRPASVQKIYVAGSVWLNLGLPMFARMYQTWPRTPGDVFASCGGRARKGRLTRIYSKRLRPVLVRDCSVAVADGPLRARQNSGPRLLLPLSLAVPRASAVLRARVPLVLERTLHFTIPHTGAERGCASWTVAAPECVMPGM